MIFIIILPGTLIIGKMANDTLIENLYHKENDTLVIDSFQVIQGNDTTLLVERIDKEIHIINKLIDRPDLGSNIFITLVFLFVLIAIIKRRKNG